MTRSPRSSRWKICRQDRARQAGLARGGPQRRAGQPRTRRGKSNIDLDKAVTQFARRIGRERIFVLPFDPHIFEGRQITLELLSAKSRRRYLELAAAISELFPGPLG